MKRIIIAAIACSFGALTAGHAQMNKAKPVAQQPAQQAATPEEVAERQTAELKKDLGLTDFQERKVYELNLGVAMKCEAIRNDNSLSPAQKKEMLDGNMRSRDERMMDMLEPAQQEKLKMRMAGPAETPATPPPAKKPALKK